MSSPQPSVQEESLEPPKKRASLSPAEILEQKEAEVARLQDEVGPPPPPSWPVPPGSVLGSTVLPKRLPSSLLLKAYPPPPHTHPSDSDGVACGVYGAGTGSGESMLSRLPSSLACRSCCTAQRYRPYGMSCYDRRS